MNIKVNKAKIKEMRKEKGWSQNQLAKQSGISLSTIERIEKKGSCRIESIKPIATVFEIDFKEFLEKENKDISSLIKIERENLTSVLPPLERYKELLTRPDEWFKDIHNVNYAYHKLFPEFRIEFSEPEDMYEPFCEFYPNNAGDMGTAYFKYNSNTLFEWKYVYCDGMRKMLPCPKIQYIKNELGENWFYYYDMSDINGTFLQFLTDNNFDLTSRGSGAPFLIFEDQEDLKLFTDYLINNAEVIRKTKADHVPDPKNYDRPINFEFLSKAKIIYNKMPSLKIYYI